jgi:hypothetical protein
MSVQKRLLALLYFLVMLSQDLSSQFVLQGVVRDNWNMPVQNALVELIDQANADQKFSGYTNQQGQYSINIDKTGTGSVPSNFPKEYRLLQNYPNPFNPSTVIGYELPYPARIRLEIHNILGQKIKTLADEYQSYPSGQIIWDATNDLGLSVSAGIYIYSLSAKGVRINRKMLLLDGGQGAFGTPRLKPGAAAGAGQFAIGKVGSNVYILRITSNGIDDYEQQDLLISGDTVLDIKVFRKITDIRRDSILSDLRVRFDSSIRTLSKREAASDMADYLKTRPEFEAAGSSDDGNAWGRFTDGRLVIYVNNMDMTNTNGPMLNKSGAVLKMKVTNDRDPSNIPESNSVFTCKAIEPEGDWVERWAELMGYVPNRATSVDELKTINNAGIFYITTHGGFGETREHRKIGDLFCLWTGTEQDPDLDKSYRKDLDTLRLVYMDAVARESNGIPVMQYRYAFTKRFVDRYMSFSKNSLVYVSGCESISDSDMVNTFFKKNASVYAGFTGDLTHSPNGIAATALFFSRVLGYNDIISSIPGYKWKEEPPQRPFDWKNVLAWMQSKKYDYGDQNGVCRLDIKPNPAYQNTGGPLAPSIATLSVHPYEDKLYLWGIFGGDPGAEGYVQIDGVPMQTLQWGYDSQVGMDQIICKIPTNDAGSCGDVQVVVRKIKGNKTQLSRYKGDFTLIHDTRDGRKFTVKLTLQFRAHLLGYRAKPGEEPIFYQKNSVVYADMGSTGKSFAEGSTTSKSGTLSWSGNCPDLHNNIDATENPSSFIAGAWFDPQLRKVQIYMSGAVQNGIIQTINGQSIPTILIFGVDTFTGSHPPLPSYFEIALNPDFSIPAGNAKARVVGTYYGILAPKTDVVTIQWDNIECNYPPRAETPR